MIYYDTDNKYLSAEIIKAGMGWHYKKYSTSKELATFQEDAMQNKLGLWIDNDPIEPSESEENNYYLIQLHKNCL